ncbi:hypothetical protein CVT24_000643 [Panaeolus cyanescens]|uniref:Uncharacterized protein n=1 Tax=Panaeolus cyanescens TaxID=181874 RepID=A0A409YTB1_9AGAR|nr:hypothetical protein CVT24_000643 [Panaeolus cyanescens]
MPSPSPALSQTSSTTSHSTKRAYSTSSSHSPSPQNNAIRNHLSSTNSSEYHHSPEQKFDNEEHGEDYEEDFGRVEFEAPLSADAELERLHHRNKLAQQAKARASESRFSIDFSLELERELAMESPPVTPAHDVLTHDTSSKKSVGSNMMSPLRHSLSTSKDSEDGNQSMSTSDSNPELDQHLSNAGSPPSITDLSPDPVILAHIITQLRQSLDEMTREKNELLHLLSTANAQEAAAKDALQLMTDKATEAQEELAEAKKKMKEDEDQIAMLRGKVEESRRGLMRLQTESRRQSMAPIDISRTNSLTLGAFASPPTTSKRASFTPLTGTFHARAPPSSGGHRRVSSVSSVTDTNAVEPSLPSPNATSTAFNIAAAEAALTGTAPPSSTKRFSGLFGRTSPQPPFGSSESDTPVPPSSSIVSINPVELESLKKEVSSLKDELDTVRHELAEATEAKEASETCVQALREFIAENNVGVAKSQSTASSMKLPPPPLMASGDEPSTSETKKTASGWGFRIWGSSTSNDAAPAAPQPASVQGSSPPPIAATSSYGNTPQSAGAPLSRKIGGFFSSRSASISSQHSMTGSIASVPAAPPLATRASSSASSTSAGGVPLRLDMKRESYTSSSFSDGSSVAEPVSPGSDVHGLGTGAYFNSKEARESKIVEEDGEVLHETFVVRDVTHLDRVRDVEVDSLKGIAPVGSVDAGLSTLR